MEVVIYFLIGLIGIVIGWLAGRQAVVNSAKRLNEELTEKINVLDRDFTSYKATTISEMSQRDLALERGSQENAKLLEQVESLKEERDRVTLLKGSAEIQVSFEKVKVQDKEKEIDIINQNYQRTQERLNKSLEELATFKANNEALTEKLQTHKDEMEKLGEKFNKDFELIANQILENKTAKFTQLNQDNLKTILEPFGKNISEFRTKVEEVYDKESKERFSLGEKVKELADLNQVISEEAKNLTKALKGEARTQGKWGEMILESILEKSGLRKDEEYFIQHQLLDEDGKPLRSDSEDKRMRPDAVIKYPDNRSVIIDSKVSLNAFSRYMSASDPDEQKIALSEHLTAIKTHIIQLSTKGYDDYDKALDFVMMFIPSEPAYIAALQADSNLWNFAYDRRILLLNPTNLITSLKLIVDLWKREYQNQNAIEIAAEGAKMYDKFVGFVDTLQGLGKSLDSANQKYNTAMNQLSEGSGNLVNRAVKLKQLGVKNKKEIPRELAEKADFIDVNDLI
ncbi:DNA recombination protein RmuC [Algoriphagus persicinus]|uniref:DNA recombination protein RmuC n=1 Tax=Algoriphagus persicinus TaxID=3108754 RepID=UPI002B3EB7A4|nr:DNA recombination protein RmuC [Algoriphagus sp. E1-3-M2]MEB2786511.1 DNA recombination protein RmuC [Algoriphagus sp. E1-3-M2]